MVAYLDFLVLVGGVLRVWRHVILLIGSFAGPMHSTSATV